jgi:hypothetical protein
VSVDAAAGVPEAAYYQAVEEFFVSRRGDPLFLSNADWLLIRDWRTAGIPLRIVLRGIRDALDAHSLSWSRHKKVYSLAYCKSEVEAARERWERALAVGAEEGADAPAFLAGLAAALRGALALGPRSRALAEGIAARLDERARAPIAPRDVEPWLAAQEAELLRQLQAEHAGSARDGEQEREPLRTIEASVDAELRPYAQRMPAKVLEQVRASAIARRLLEAHGLPRLSLFGL